MQHGFLFDHGSYTTLDVPGSSSTFAIGINDLGQIVGGYRADTGFHGFLLDQGSYTTLNVPGSDFTYAFRINASSQIVGYYTDRPVRTPTGEAVAIGTECQTFYCFPMALEGAYFLATGSVPHLHTHIP